MARASVSLTLCDNYEFLKVRAALERQFSLLGGMEQFVSRSDSVLIKPNFIAPKPAKSATQTDPAVILALAQLLKDFGASPFVADSPAWSNAQTCAEVLGLAEPLRKLGVEVKQLNKPKYCRLDSGATVGISSTALEADKIINLPKLKAHQQLMATIAVKNMFGCVSGKAKALWHFRKGADKGQFCRMLIDIYKLLSPVLTIVDGIVAMEGPGPISGKARKLGLLIGGVDPIAVEIICSRLINIAPEELPIVQAAKEAGFACAGSSQIEVVGDNIDNFLCADFERAEQVPLRFTLPRIAKSLVKQLLMLARLKQ